MKIYHNPRCSKSRQTLALLENKNVEVEIIEYLKTPPTVSELTNILKQLNVTPTEILRQGEAEYKEFIKGKSLSAEELIQLMVKYPKVIERPIVSDGKKAIIGRPPENVFELIV